MKKIIGLLSVLVVLILGAYYGMGIATERVIKHQLQRVNSSNGVYVKVINYSRHWFKSTADFEWELQIPERTTKTADGQIQTVPAETYTVQTPLTVFHGPIIFANNTVKFGLGYAYSDINMPSKFEQQFKENFTDTSVRPNLNVSLLVTYLNHSKLDIEVPKFNLVAKKGGQFDWLGLDNTVDISYDAAKVKGYISSEGFKFLKDETKSVLNKVSSNYKLHKLENGLFLGKADFDLSLFGVYQKELPIFELSELKAMSDSDINDGLVYSNFNTSLKKVLVNGVAYGPGTLDMSIKNLDAEVLAKINNQVNRVQQGTEAEKTQAMLELLPEVPKLFSRGAEFEISKLEFTMPQGVVKGDLMIALPNGQATHPLELVQKIHGQAKLTVPVEVAKFVLVHMNRKQLAASQANSTTPEAPPATTEVQNATAVLPVNAEEAKVAEMTNAQLNKMVQSGLLVLNNTDYQIEATLNQGQLLINNHPFTPQMLQY